MGWSPEKNLTERFKDAVNAAASIHPRWKLGRTYDGWSEALVKWSPKVVPLIQRKFQQHMLAVAGPFAKHYGWTPFAVDGSRVEAPRTTANEEALGCAGKVGTTPQLMLTVLFHMGLGLPWSFRTGPGTESERTHLEQMLPELPEDALLVADAGFVSYGLCRRMMREKRHFLLRVGGNKQLLSQAMEGCAPCSLDNSQHEVWLWPYAEQSANQQPLRLRLMVIGEGKHAVYLLTNVLDEKRLTFKQATELYGMRWGEEVFFRSFKQTMSRGTLRSHAPRNCFVELTWNLLSIWLLGLLSVRELRAAGLPPADWSPAASRNVIRDTLRRGDPSRGGTRLAVRLRGCVKDGYTRKGKKTTRELPRKKKQRPPGPPKMRPPRLEEVQRAQRLGVELLEV